MNCFVSFENSGAIAPFQLPLWTVNSFSLLLIFIDYYVAQAQGFEPWRMVLEAIMLPLHHTCISERNKIRTCTAAASTQCSTIGAIRSFVCYEHWLISYFLIIELVHYKLAESKGVEPLYRFTDSPSLAGWHITSLSTLRYVQLYFYVTNCSNIIHRSLRRTLQGSVR